MEFLRFFPLVPFQELRVSTTSDDRSELLERLLSVAAWRRRALERHVDDVIVIDMPLGDHQTTIKLGKL